MRTILGIILLIATFSFTVSAQSEADLGQHFEGKQIKLRIDMPASKAGVDIYPERAQSLNYTDYSSRLKEHGASIQRGDTVTIANVKVDYEDDQIDVVFADHTRFVIHYTRLAQWMLTPATVVSALNRYVEFNETEKRLARLEPSTRVAAGYLRRGVIHLGPKSTFLKEGLSTDDVVKVLGQPSATSEAMKDGKTVSIYEFERGEGRVLIAEFVGNLLVGSRTELRSNGSVAILNR